MNLLVVIQSSEALGYLVLQHLRVGNGQKFLVAEVANGIKRPDKVLFIERGASLVMKEC